MKTLFKTEITAAVLIISLLMLVGCGNSYVMLHYDDFSHMQDALSFTMRTVPGEEAVYTYGAQDKKLGELQYIISDDTGLAMGTLSFRMAEVDYIADFATPEKPGAAGIDITDMASGTDRIGTCEISYYYGGNTAFAVWEREGMAYSVAVVYSDGYEEIAPGWDSVYSYVVAIISTK